MKKQILEALKAKFEGVNESILSRIADKLAKTVLKEEDVATAVEGVSFQSILDSDGDRRATEASQTAVRNYETKHGLKDGNKAQGGAPAASEPAQEDGDTDPDTPAWAKALIKSNKELSGKVAAMEGEKVTSTRKTKLDAIVAKLPENLRKPYARISISPDMSDEDFTAMTAEITTEVEGLLTETATRGATFGRPMGGGSSSVKATDADKPSAQETDAVANAMGLK